MSGSVSVSGSGSGEARVDTDEAGEACTPDSTGKKGKGCKGNGNSDPKKTKKKHHGKGKTGAMAERRLTASTFGAVAVPPPLPSAPTADVLSNHCSQSAVR